MKRTAITLMAIAIFSKVLGFGRELTLSYTYGTSSISDAYLIALTIPSAIFGFVSNGLVAGYIPMYNRIVAAEGEAGAQTFTSNLANIMFVICSIVISVSLAFTGPIVKFFASGFSGDTLNLCIRFTKITLLAIYFPSLVAIYTGYLQIKGNFVVPAFVGVPFNLLVIISLFLSLKLGLITMAIGFVLAMGAKWFLLIAYARSDGYKYRFYLHPRNPRIKEFFLLVLPVIIGVSVNEINVLVDRTIASTLVEGGISALNYANRLTAFAQGIFVASISTVLYPLISKLAIEQRITELKQHLSTAITGISLLMVPSVVGMVLFAQPIVTILFRRGAFDADSVALTAYALSFYAIGMIGWGITDVSLRAFYAFQNTKTPTILAIVGVAVNIVLNLVLSRYIGIGGLALATSIAALTVSFLMLLGLRKKIGALGLTKNVIAFFKIVIASLIMGVGARISFGFLLNMMGQNLSLILSIILAVIIYALLIYFMRIEEVDNVVDRLKLRFKCK